MSVSCVDGINSKEFGKFGDLLRGMGTLDQLRLFPNQCRGEWLNSTVSSDMKTLI
jgi:hypothetical protein